MAVLALGFVGTAIGSSIGGTLLGIAASSIGGFIGSTIGSMVDNMLFPQKQEGPRLDDLAVQTSTYGNPIPVLYGPENRIAGNVIWSSGLKETRHKQKSGGLPGKGGPSVQTTTYSYSSSFAVALCEGTISSIKKIWANGKLVYDFSTGTAPDDGGIWADLRIYNGDFSQMPDPTIEAVEGIGNTSAYRGTAYVVFTDCQLADYGNRLPLLQFLVEKDEEISAAAVLLDLAERCGLDATHKVSTSSVKGTVRGYAIGALSSGTGAIQPMALVYDFDSAQVGGALRFTPRGLGMSAVVPFEHLAGHQGDEERPEAISWARSLETSLPREASVSFSDPERDYQVNSQVARRQTGSADSNLQTQVAIVIDVDQARQLADRMLWEAWTGRTTANAQTDDRWINLEAGRVYGFETPAGIEPLRLRRRTRGANGVIQMELSRDRAEVYRSTATGARAPVPEQLVNFGGPTTIRLFDAPILADENDDSGFYYVVDGLGAGWRGADVLRSSDGAVTFDELAPIGLQGVLGSIDMLGTGPSEVFDLVNVVRVTLDDPSDELDSITELELLNGSNACWIGPADGSPGEVLQFKTATLIAPGVYDLSTLLRGRLGTEWAIGLHASGDNFIMLTNGNLQRQDYGPADWNKDRAFKAVTLLSTEADADQVDFTNTGEGQRPLSPVHITGDTSTGDLVISWIRRSRYRQPGLGGGTLALGETTESYEVDILDSPGGSLLRTITATTPTATYLAADQVSDGLAPGDIIGVEVYQMNEVRGRGRPGIAELEL